MTRTSILRSLEELGLVSTGYIHQWRAEGPAWPKKAGGHALDAHSGNANLLRSLLLAALWPSVVRVDQPSAKYNASSSGAVLKEAVAREVHYFDEHDGRVFLQPSSVLFHANRYKSNYLAVCNKSANAATKKTYLRDATEVPMYALLLFGGPLYVDHAMGGLTISTTGVASADGWIKMRASARIGVLCRQLRELMDRTLASAVEDPQALLASESQQVVRAMIALVTHDGLD